MIHVTNGCTRHVSLAETPQCLLVAMVSLPFPNAALVESVLLNRVPRINLRTLYLSNDTDAE